MKSAIPDSFTYKVANLNGSLVVEHGLLDQVQLPAKGRRHADKQSQEERGRDNGLASERPLQRIGRVLGRLRDEDRAMGLLQRKPYGRGRHGRSLLISG